MEIEQSFTVPYPRDAVWKCFHDTREIVGCLPGASLTAPPENGLLKLAMTVKLGPIVAAFAGDGEMKLDEHAYQGSVSGGGVDRKSASRVKGVAAFALDDSTPGATRVDVKVDYTIAGSLAQFSRGGIVKELATRMTEAFAVNLKNRLDESVVREQPAAAAEPVATAATGPVTDVVPEPIEAPRPTVVREAQPLNLGNMFWKIVWSRLRGLFGARSH